MRNIVWSGCWGLGGLCQIIIHRWEQWQWLKNKKEIGKSESKLLAKKYFVIAVSKHWIIGDYTYPRPFIV